MWHIYVHYILPIELNLVTWYFMKHQTIFSPWNYEKKKNFQLFWKICTIKHRLYVVWVGFLHCRLALRISFLFITYPNSNFLLFFFYKYQWLNGYSARITYASFLLNLWLETEPLCSCRFLVLNKLWLTAKLRKRHDK